MEAQVEALARRIRGLSCTSVSRPALVYFDIVGICWPIRCLLHLTGTDYDLIQLPIQAWAYRRDDGTQPLPGCFRNSHVPLYVDPDVYLTQSNVILAHLAERHGWFGDGPQDRLAIMEVMAHGYDALFHWSGLFPTLNTGNIPQEVVQARLAAFLGEGTWGVMSDGYHRNLGAFEGYLDANPDGDSGFLVGRRPSVADLQAFNVLCNWYKAFDPERFVTSFPRLDEYLHRIAALPGVGEYRCHHQERTLWFPLPGLALRLTRPEDLAGLTTPDPVGA